MTNRKFPQKERIRKRYEFDKVLKEGKAFREPWASVFVLPNSLGHSRLGVIASKKLGGATRRNRIKRLLRECYRLNKEPAQGLDVVIIPRVDIPEDFKDVERHYLSLLKKISSVQ